MGKSRTDSKLGEKRGGKLKKKRGGGRQPSKKKQEKGRRLTTKNLGETFTGKENPPQRGALKLVERVNNQNERGRHP